MRKIKTIDLEDEIIINTNNSYINEEQIKYINKEDFKRALIVNKNYQISKKRYEITLLKYLVDKYKYFKSGKSNLTIKAVNCYEKLVKRSKNLLEDIDKKNAMCTPFNDFEMRNKAKLFLKDFIEDLKIFHENDDLGNDDQKAIDSFPIWKKKISEMVNIWDLYSNNGNDMKFTHKYLQVKKFFSLRQFLKQNSLELESGKKKRVITNNNNIPFMILLDNDILRYFIDLLTFVFLVYSLLISPMKMFLGTNNMIIKILSKITDMFFFIEIIFNLRTIYKDKSNNIVYDTNSIFLNYFQGFFFIDLLTTIPLEFFFIYIHTAYVIVEALRRSFKILRIAKLIPIITKLEQTNYAIYFRILKISFILFFFIHWLGCIIIDVAIDSFAWNAMNQTCYYSYHIHTKHEMKNNCIYLYALYQGSYILSTQYTITTNLTIELQTAAEYAIFILEYQIGQLIGAYVFGGMTSLIQNLNQGENFFTSKIDMLNEHMTFYDISYETQNDIKTYYQYLWQKHRDIIYGRNHFELLSLSLKEKFEVNNLVDNEIYLAIIYNLNIGNPKIVGNILMGLKKTILFPYEILFEEGSVSKGIYILQDGTINLIKKSDNFHKIVYEVTNKKKEGIKEKRKKEEIETEKENKKNLAKYDESLSYIFPMIPALIKTGRNWQTCYSEDFTDLMFLTMDDFDKIIENFPVEMHTYKTRIANFVEEKKLFDIKSIFDIISAHSSRSVGKYYEKKYNKYNIWIPIPIPISQKKIARNYVNCFIKKIKNHWREIAITGNIDIGFNSYLICQTLKTNDEKEKKIENIEIKNVKNNNDVLEDIKNLARVLQGLSKNLKNNINSKNSIMES